MRQAARHEQVFCKVSALAESARRRHGRVPDDIGFYRPVLEAAWKTFGEDRLIYASNWPVCLSAARYAEVQRIAAEYIRSKGTAAAEKFFRRNSQRAYGWKTRSASQSSR